MWLTLNRVDPEQALACHFALSALHGLIPADTFIDDYDLKMTSASADDLVGDPSRSARSMDGLRCCARGSVEACIVGSRLYVETGRRLIEAAQARGILPGDLVLTPINDQIGMMRRRMAAWLLAAG